MVEIHLQSMNNLQKSIIEYYDNTWLDYRVLWLNKKDRAIHFGYYESFTESHSQALEKLNQVMANKAKIKASDTLLDAGCGQGGSSLWLAKNVGCETVGVTLVPHQVETASKEAILRGLDHKSKFLQKDYTATGLESSSFDVVWACESLCHAQEKIKFYSEAYRLLKPGGRLVVAEYIRKSRNFEPADEAILNHWCKGWSMPDLDSWEEHEANMNETGFIHLSQSDITSNVMPSLSKLFRMSKKLMPLGILLNKLRIRNNIKHGNQTASVSQYEALTKKLWYYCIFTAQKPTEF